MITRSSRASRGLIVAATIATGALVLVPGTGDAAQKVRFGAKLNPTVQPSNSLPARDCLHQDPGKPCTLVMNEAYGRPPDINGRHGGEKAPVSGTLIRVKIIAGGPGRAKLFLTKAHKVNGVWRAKVKGVGPKIRYHGQSQSNWDNDVYNVESFKVDIPIKKGWRLSLRTRKNSAYRCSGGSDNTLIFQPPLTFGGPYTDAKSDEGCFLLLEGIIKKPRR